MESCDKKKSDKDALFQALLNDKLDVVVFTDHAPSYYRGKIKHLFQSPSQEVL